MFAVETGRWNSIVFSDRIYQMGNPYDVETEENLNTVTILLMNKTRCYFEIENLRPDFVQVS